MGIRMRGIARKQNKMFNPQERIFMYVILCFRN